MLFNNLRRLLDNYVVVLLGGQTRHHFMAVGPLNKGRAVLLYDFCSFRVFNQGTCLLGMYCIIRSLFKEA